MFILYVYGEKFFFARIGFFGSSGHWKTMALPPCCQSGVQFSGITFVCDSQYIPVLPLLALLGHCPLGPLRCCVVSYPSLVCPSSGVSLRRVCFCHLFPPPHPPAPIELESTNNVRSSRHQGCCNKVAMATPTSMQ